MYDIITFGSATRDIFARSGEFKIVENPVFLTGKGLAVGAGEKVYIEDLVFSSGGGGTNAAATFALQEFNTAYVGLLGHDLAGRELMRELHKLGIFCDFVKIVNKAETSVSIVLSIPDGERTILVREGASHLLSEKDIPWDKIEKAKWFYISGLAGESAKVFKPLITFANKNKIKIAVNPGHDQLGNDLEVLKSLLDKIDILIVNQEEASLITGIDYSGQNDRYAECSNRHRKEEELFKKFDGLIPGIAVMTKGPDGVSVSDGKNIYRAGIPESEIIDRTGAGDAFGSGFVSGIMEKDDIEYAIQLGTANATSKVQQIGAKNGLLKKGEWGEWEKIQVNTSKINY